MKGDELVITLAPPEVAEGELIPREPMWRFAAYAGGNIALAGETDDPSLVIQSAGDRPVIAHDAKALGDVPPNLVFDTAVAGYLLDPARRGYPLDELAEERAIAADAGDELATYAVLIYELAKAQRPQIQERGLTDLMNDVELPLVHVLRETEKAGIKLDTKQLETVATRIRANVIELEREIWDLAGEEFVIGSPQQLGAVLFEKLELSRKRRGKTGFSTDAKVLQAIRDEHPIIPKIERFRELSKLAQTYLDALPNWIGADGRLHTTFEQTTAATGRLEQHQPEPPEHPDPHGDRPRDPRLLHPRARKRPAERGLQPGRAAGPGPHRQRAGPARHLPARRGRAHRDRERRLRPPARATRRGHAQQGQDGQLRDRLRPQRLRPRRPAADPAGGGQGSSSTATSSASPPSRSS